MRARLSHHGTGCVVPSRDITSVSLCCFWLGSMIGSIGWGGGQCPDSCGNELLGRWNGPDRESSDSSERAIHAVGSERVGIEAAADPAEHLGVLRMVGVADRLQEFLVARNAPAEARFHRKRDTA